MPPKLTSKNIFDVVFEQLPADAFIDTGPASLREELMLEAAGMSGGTDEHNSQNRNSGSGRGGSSQFRRHLLPSSSIAAAGANAIRSSATSKGAASAATTTSVEDDVLGEEAAVYANGGASAPPAYAATSAVASHLSAQQSRGVDGPSLFRRVDDDDGAEALTAVVGAESRGGTRVAGGDPQGTEGDGFDLAMQMDEEDDAVKEAMKDAKLLATIRAEAEEAESEGGGASRAGGLHGSRGAASGASTLGQGVLATVGGAEGATVLPNADGQPGRSTVGTSSPSLHAKENGGGSVAQRLMSSSSGTTTAAVGRSAPLTAEEQLARMPPGLDRVYTGSCVMYRHPKGFGFISPDCGGPDVYFINDGIVLSFTRLALRAFYLKNAMPLPPSIAAFCRGAGGVGRAEGAAAHTTSEEAEVPGKVATTNAQSTQDDTKEKIADEGQRTDTPASEATTTTTTATSATGVEVNVAKGVLEDTDGMSPNHGGAAVLPAAAVADIGDRVSLPPTTAAELTQAEAAAALLTPATAALLQHQVDQGFGGGARVGERFSFVVTRNHAGRGGNGRLLRAEFIRGVPIASFAMPVEQSWFAPMFAGAVGRKANPHGVYNAVGSAAPHNPHASLGGGSGGRGAEGEGAPAAQSTSGGVAVDNNAEGMPATAALVRYTGCVRTYDAEDQRGYLRCDETDGGGGSPPDVVFHAHAFLWDLARCPPLKRQVKESMQVAYSVCGTERNGKYIATLITTPAGEPFSEENTTFAENVRPFYMADSVNRRRGRGDDNAGGLGSGRAMNSAEGGMGGGGDGGGGDRKRAKAAEEDLLLFEDDDYPFM